MQNQTQVRSTLSRLYNESKSDHFKMIKGLTKSLYRPVQPSDFKDVALAISNEQGEFLINLIVENNFKKIVEFGTSFGISTLFLALGAKETGGNIVTSEILEIKAKRALQNFQEAGVSEFIEVRIGDAMETLRDYSQPIDLLLLDGWKDLYLPLFRMLEPNLHSNSVVYVDNANMSETKIFLKEIATENKYDIHFQNNGKAALIKAMSSGLTTTSSN